MNNYEKLMSEPLKPIKISLNTFHVIELQEFLFKMLLIIVRVASKTGHIRFVLSNHL